MPDIDRFMEKLAVLFERMDTEYNRAARTHGFECRGCEDNCCYTRFFHHTLVEYLYIKEGLRRLSADDRQRIFERATETVELMNDLDRSGQPVRVLCPLNTDGQCRLYAYRPMICRLHGIPHQLHRPDGRRQVGPGCGDFDRQCAQDDQTLLDRTPFYVELAGLEKQVRNALQFEARINMTIAEMIIAQLLEK